MIARVNWGRKKPRSARLPAFDELTIPGVIHVEDMGNGVLSVSLGDGDSRLLATVSRRGVAIVEEEGVTR